MSLPLKLPHLAALYLLWFGIWVVVGPETCGPEFLQWSRVAMLAGKALLAVWLATRVPPPYRVFLGLLALSDASLGVSWGLFDPYGGVGNPRMSPDGKLQLSQIACAAFAFLLVCAWGHLALEQWRKRPPNLLTGAVFALLVAALIGLASAVLHNFDNLDKPLWNSLAGRLAGASGLLGYSGLILGIGCVLLGEALLSVPIVLGLTLTVGSDMSFATYPITVGAIWMAGQSLWLSALLRLPERLHPLQFVAEALPEKRSGLSGWLVMLSFGVLLMALAVARVPLESGWKAMFALLFIVLLVLILVHITHRVDTMVMYLKSHTQALHRNRLQAADWRETQPSLRATLDATGLGEYLDALRESSARLRQDLLFLGPERLFPPPKRSGGHGKPGCFLVMPFSLEWSKDVHRTLAQACKSLGVQALRGDDVFTPTDILDDIWQSLNGADFIIADITGRNANVMYELGMAHTLAKPVLIISRNAADIPIDLATRRVILYGQPEEGDWRDDLETKAVKAIGEILKAYGMAAEVSPSLG